MVEFIESGKLALWAWWLASPVLAVLIIALLGYVLRIVIRLSRIIDYVDHVRELMLRFEAWPMMVLDKIISLVIPKDTPTESKK